MNSVGFLKICSVIWSSRGCLGTRRHHSQVGCLAPLKLAPLLALGQERGSSARQTLDLEMWAHRYK